MVYTLYEITPGDTFFKLALKFNSTVELIQNANGHIDPRNIPVGINIKIPILTSIVNTTLPYTSSITEKVIRKLSSQFEFISLEIIGKSIMGRDIFALKMGAGINRVLINASHHANESITTPVTLICPCL